MLPWGQFHQGPRKGNVFELPEPLENVLPFLAAIDLLRVQQVNNSFSEVMQKSPLLQKSMGLRARKDGFLDIAFLSLPPSSRFGRTFHARKHVMGKLLQKN